MPNGVGNQTAQKNSDAITEEPRRLTTQFSKYLNNSAEAHTELAALLACRTFR